MKRKSSGTKLSVCHLIDDLSHGGAQVLLADIIEHSSASVDPTVCYIGKRSQLHGRVEAAGADVYSLDGQFRFDPRPVDRLWRFFRDRSFDILHTHLVYAQLMGRIVGRAAGIKNIISTYHAVPGSYTSDRRMRVLEKATRPLDTVSVGVSEGVVKAFSDTWYFSQRGDFRVINNGIDIDRFQQRIEGVDTQAWREHLGVDDKFVFLNVGRLVPNKRQIDLLNAVDSFDGTSPKIHLIICGAGRLESDLRETVRKRGLDDDVTLAGHVDDIEAYYALADGYVNAAVHEGFGLTLVEAMSAGLPVITTTVPGAGDVAGDTAIGVSPESPAELAKAMLSIATDADRRKELAVRGVERAMQNFDISTTAKQYCNLYTEISKKS